MSSYTIGICGGTASGKSTLTRRLLDHLGPERADVLRHDCYYRDLSHLSDEERWVHNFDHPDALETELLVQHLSELRQGKPVCEPVYNYALNCRGLAGRTVNPRPILVVEGILILADHRLRQQLDLKVYVDAPADLRLARRLQRDPIERNLPMEYVVKQYLETVRPMHEEFVEPSRQHADLIFSGVTPEEADRGLHLLLQKISQQSNRRQS